MHHLLLLGESDYLARWSRGAIGAGIHIPTPDVACPAAFSPGQRGYLPWMTMLPPPVTLSSAVAAGPVSSAPYWLSNTTAPLVRSTILIRNMSGAPSTAVSRKP